MAAKRLPRKNRSIWLAGPPSTGHADHAATADGEKRGGGDDDEDDDDDDDGDDGDDAGKS